jgi:FkbM family methyltransferase
MSICTTKCSEPCDWDSLLIKRVAELIKPGSNILDIGAHTGDFVLGIDKVVDDYLEIIAVEADKDNFDRLQERCKGIGSIRYINAAVIDEVRMVNLYEGTGQPQTINVLGAFAHPDQGFTRNGIWKGIVHGTTIDHICKKLRMSFDIIKIDVEGAEALVLNGVLDEIPYIEYMFVEIHNSDTYKQIFKRCHDSGWTMKCLRNLHTIKECDDDGFCYQVVIKP